MSLLTAFYWLFNNVLLTFIYLPALCSVHNNMKPHVSKTKICFVLRIFHLETGQSTTLPSILAVRGGVYHKTCFDLLFVIGQTFLGLTVHIFLRNICIRIFYLFKNRGFSCQPRLGSKPRSK